MTSINQTTIPASEVTHQVIGADGLTRREKIVLIEDTRAVLTEGS